MYYTVVIIVNDTKYYSTGTWLSWTTDAALLKPMTLYKAEEIIAWVSCKRFKEAEWKLRVNSNSQKLILSTIDKYSVAVHEVIPTISTVIQKVDVIKENG